MGTIYEDKIDDFFGGISDDIRLQDPEVFSMSQHLDVFTNPKRMTPYRAMEADEDTAKSIVIFDYTGTLWGLGIVAASAKSKVFYKGSGDPIGGSWTALGNGEDSGGARSEVFFKAFHGYMYGSAAGTRLWAADLTGVAVFTTTAYSGANGAICQGLITRDDKLIVPCVSGIAVKNGAGSGPTNAWTTPLVIPAAYTVTDLCETGDKVALAARPTSGIGNSKVFIWDKVSSDVDDVIDWGEGDLYILDEVEGELIGISSVGGASAFAIRPKAVIRKWSGGSKARVHSEVEGDAGTSLTVYGNHTKAKDGNRIIFGFAATIDGVAYNQLAVVGRKSEKYPLAFTLDRKVDNDTALTGNVQGVLKLGNYFWVAHNQDGSVNRTNDQSVYTNATATYISQKITGERHALGLHRKAKRLTMAGLLGVPLTSGQSMSLYYRVDGTTAWTLIRTYSTVAGLGFETGMADTNNDGTPDEEFLSCKEFQFKVTATGGAEPTAIIYRFEDLGSDVASAD